MYSHIVI